MKNNNQDGCWLLWTPEIQPKECKLQHYIATVSKYCKRPPTPVRFNIIIAGVRTAQLCILPAAFPVNYLRLTAIALKSKRQVKQVFYYVWGLYQGNNTISAVGKFHNHQQKMKEFHVAAPALQPVWLLVPDRQANVPVNSSRQQTHQKMTKCRNHGRVTAKQLQ